MYGPSKFYENSKFSKKVSGDKLSGEGKGKGKRKRILTSENDSQSSNIAKAAKLKKYKKSRKTSISDSEFNSFYQAYEQHAKNKKDSSDPSASIHSAFNSTKVSPNIKATKKITTRDSNLSLKCNEVPDSSRLSPEKPKRGNKGAKGEHARSDGQSQKSIPLPTWNMISIVDSLKELENEIDHQG